MATTYKSEYEAAMDGMRGAEICDYEVFEKYAGIGNARSVLRVIRCLTYMERGETVYVLTNLATGMSASYDVSANGVIRQAEDIHPNNKPTAYEVTRNARGYKVNLIFANG